MERVETRPDVAREVAAEAGAPMRKEEMAALRPAVDICEDAGGITVRADMPGVTKDRLNVQVDRHRLLIEGEAAIEMPDGMEALHADVQSTRYARSFSLSGELESEHIEASLKDGVLTVRIPKRSEFRPRKIDVRIE